MKKHLFILLGLSLGSHAIANNNLQNALICSTINSAVATGTAIGLQRAGYQTETVITPYGATTVIKNQDDSNRVNIAPPISNQQRQSEITQQQLDFMNN